MCVKLWQSQPANDTPRIHFTIATFVLYFQVANFFCAVSPFNVTRLFSRLSGLVNCFAETSADVDRRKRRQPPLPVRRLVTFSGVV